MTQTPLPKRIAHLVEFLFLLVIFVLTNLFPFWSLHGVARCFRILFYPVLGQARRRIRSHVSELLGIREEKALRQFTNRNLEHTIRCFLELMQSWKMRNPRFIRKYVEFAEEAMAVAQDRSQGVVFAEGHFGNWEIPIPAYASIGFKVHFAAQRIANPYVDWMVRKMREGYGGGSAIYLKESEKYLPLLRRKEPIGLVADQDAGGDGIFVDFLGKKAATHAGPAVLAYLGKARLAIGFCVFQGKGRYRFYIRTLYRFQAKSDFASTREAAEKLTRLWVAELEKEVRKYPEQYFWVHRRWKTRPPEEIA
ncbi:MAG: lysophospholipid acyltransferase family protein [Turneriella sp.]|nr:lysophospholipid acyltransferase family protein [Leptospiraceae bacterium]MCX7631821.1 lysophospholipid acyltransferase family protein [Turneriella sp.]